MTLTFEQAVDRVAELLSIPREKIVIEEYTHQASFFEEPHKWHCMDMPECPVITVYTDFDTFQPQYKALMERIYKETDFRVSMGHTAHPLYVRLMRHPPHEERVRILKENDKSCEQKHREHVASYKKWEAGVIEKMLKEYGSKGRYTKTDVENIVKAMIKLMNDEHAGALALAATHGMH